ncbi:hypothetical protein Y032_0104g3620 [Ancylostoma ceylanicum]|uniref:Uncharacterized protein n=2 Tax=Ancylostoma ceylanicum TaxID=53326 RepID=A0A016TGK4_9BILA|nr:hypothetical protein Y032_0104g3620 [Ancylostoma ceylanicum]
MENKHGKVEMWVNSGQMEGKWWSYRCCVPTSTVLWLVIMLFIFTVIVCICCCLSVAFVRWIYKRRIRSKAECLKNRYDQEGRARREMEFKLKELAMRPVHGHHHHQLERHHQSDDTNKQRSESYKPSAEDLAQHQKFLSNITQNTAYFNPPGAPGVGVLPMKDPLYTGDTPLTSRRSDSMPPPQLFTGRTPLVSQRSDVIMPTSTSYLTAGTKSTASYFSPSTGALAQSSSTPAATTESVIRMEPRDVAATAHAIVTGGGGRAMDSMPPYPGILLLNKDQRPHGQCPSDRLSVIPSRSDTHIALGGPTTSTVTGEKTESSIVKSEISPVVARHATAHGYVLASLISDISKSDRKKKHKKHLRSASDSASDVIGRKRASEVDIHVPKSSSTSQEQRKMDLKRKRRSSKHQPARVKETDSRPSSLPSSRSFFPYWTGRRRVFSKVEPVVSPSGRTRGAKVATSETNIWEPCVKSSAESARRRIGTSSESGSSSKPSSGQSQPLPTPPRPAVDVYELRRQVERMKADKLSRGMKEITSTPKRSRSRTRYSPVRVTNSAQETPSPRGAVRSLDSRPVDRGPRKDQDMVEGRVTQL